MISLLKRAIALVATVTIPLIAVAPAHAVAIDRLHVTVDCDLGEEYEDDHNIAESDVLTIRLIDCDGYSIAENDDLGNSSLAGNVVLTSTQTTLSGNDVTLTVVGSRTAGSVRAADLELDGARQIDIDVFIAGPSFEPDAELLDTKSLRLTSSSTELMIAEDQMSGPGDDGNGNVNMGGLETCQIEAGPHVFTTYTFTVEVAGNYDFRAVDASPFDEDLYWGVDQYPSSDPFIALYDEFDPTDPYAGIVGCNDDGNESGYPEIDNTWIFDADFDYDALETSTGYIIDDQFPWFRSDLEPGEYTLVYYPYYAIDADDFAAGRFDESSRNGPSAGNVTWEPTAQSVTYEMWGPQDGFGAEGLAPTGGVEPTLALWAGLAVVGAGFAIGAGRRREQRA